MAKQEKYEGYNDRNKDQINYWELWKDSRERNK